MKTSILFVLLALMVGTANTAHAFQNQIRDFYVIVLGREPDAGGLNYWTNQAYAGMSLSTIRLHIAHSQESQNNVGNAYTFILGRPVEEAGLHYWVNQMATSISVTQMREAVAYSQEAANAINAQYVELLGRNADAGGLEHYRQKISQIGIQGIRNEIANSQEYRQRHAPPPPPPMQAPAPQREALNCWGKPIRIYGPCG